MTAPADLTLIELQKQTAAALAGPLAAALAAFRDGLPAADILEALQAARHAATEQAAIVGLAAVLQGSQEPTRTLLQTAAARLEAAAGRLARAENEEPTIADQLRLQARREARQACDILTAAAAAAAALEEEQVKYNESLAALNYKALARVTTLAAALEACRTEQAPAGERNTDIAESICEALEARDNLEAAREGLGTPETLQDAYAMVTIRADIREALENTINEFSPGAAARAALQTLRLADIATRFARFAAEDIRHYDNRLARGELSAAESDFRAAAEQADSARESFKNARWNRDRAAGLEYIRQGLQALEAAGTRLESGAAAAARAESESDEDSPPLALAADIESYSRWGRADRSYAAYYLAREAREAADSALQYIATGTAAGRAAAAAAADLESLAALAALED